MKPGEVGSSSSPAAPRIAPWKFVAGVMIHLGVPAYLLLLVVTLIVYVLNHGTADGVLSLLPRISLYFIALYSAATIAGTGFAALVGLAGRARRDRRLVSSGEGPATHSAQALAHAGALLGAMKEDPAIESALQTIMGTTWHHDDERYQQVSRDLDKAAGAYASAYAAASREQRQEIGQLTAGTLQHVAQRLDDLAQDTTAAATRKAQTMAGYIASKYGDDLDAVR